MADRDSIEDLATRLDMLEQITLDMATVLCRQNSTVRGALIDEMEDSVSFFLNPDGSKTDRSSIIQAFVDQMRS